MASSPKVFLLGATSYIGGSATTLILSQHPTASFSALVRSPAGATALQSSFPSVRIVTGDLDSFELIAREAEAADIVINFAHADHMGAVNAIAAGLAKRTKESVYIHTSGAGNLGDRDRLGEYTGTEKHNDLSGVAEILALPPSRSHRPVEIVVQEIADKTPLVKTAIVCPPMIHGLGNGSGNNRSQQIPKLLKGMLIRGEVFTLMGGHNIWNEVNVRDLAVAFSLLFEAGLKELGFESKGGAEVPWGKEAYYFVEDGEVMWSDISQYVVDYLKANPESPANKYIKLTDTIPSITVAEADKLGDHTALYWGMNSRGKGERAAKYLGWAAKYPKLKETIGEELEYQTKLWEKSK